MHLTNTPSELQIYLRTQRWLEPDETVEAVEKPGEGNMNYTLRVRTPHRTLIVKQSRAYVEKYPQIPAPAERARLEGAFYQQIAAYPGLQAFMPRLYGMDEAHNVLALEDLGESSDYTRLYQPGQTLSAEDLGALLTYVSELHRAFQTDAPVPAFANEAMRQLNHEHIFRYPFLEENGFNLDQVQPGLQEAAMPYKQDEAPRKAVTALGERYFPGKPGRVTLLHGDYYPGSWLSTATGIKVIDPEFAFYGPAEFDLGVMLAHLYLSEQPAGVREAVLSGYAQPEGFDESLMRQFAGVEILRRLIGLAQLPLSLSLEAKKALLREARMMVL